MNKSGIDAPAHAMRVLSLHPLSKELLIDGRADPVIPVTTPEGLSQAIDTHHPNVLIAGPGQMDDGVLAGFLRSDPAPWMRVVSHDTIPANAPMASGLPDGVLQNRPLHTEAEQESTLQAVEQAFAREVVFESTGQLLAAQARDSGKGERVLVVGAGIVNLITALRLSMQGRAVTVIDRSVFPRVPDQWEKCGCTHGGQDARMYTVTEFDNYNEKRNSIYQNMSEVFSRPLSEGGWVTQAAGDRGAEEIAWNDMFQRVPPWLARGYTQEIYQVGSAAHARWRALFEDCPSLREGVGLREGVLRTYDDPVKFESSAELQQQLGMLRRRLTPQEVRSAYPIFAQACDQGAILAALEIEGFTVQVHEFVAKLVTTLESRGVRFQWDCRAQSFQRNAEGVILGVETPQGLISSDHYVVSPGVDGGELLQGFDSRPLLHGVLGAWMTLPRPRDTLSRSVKIKRSARLNEDANITVTTNRDGEPLLIIGSGYGYVGSRRDSVDPAQLQLMYQELHDIGATFFSREYQEGVGQGMPQASLSYCIRPWTPTGLGVFEVQPAEHGLAIVTGGHNTGGFAVSPVVADAVCSALRGEVADMHWQFHPRRLAASIPTLNRYLRAGP